MEKIEIKKCTKCKKILSIDFFYRKKGGGITHAACKKCYCERQFKYKKNLGEKIKQNIRESNKKYYDKNRDSIIEDQRRRRILDKIKKSGE